MKTLLMTGILYLFFCPLAPLPPLGCEAVCVCDDSGQNCEFIFVCD